MNTSTRLKNILDTVQLIQRILAGIIGSTILVLWVSSWQVVINIYSPNHLTELSDLRASIASKMLYIACLIGVGSVIWLLIKGVELKRNYDELIEIKKKKEEEE